MTDNGPRYDYSAAAAAHILNILWGSDEPKSILFSKLLFVILDSMYAAERELYQARYTPSEN